MNFLLVVVNCLFLKIPYFKHFGPDTLCNFLNEKCSDRIEERVLNTSVRALIFFLITQIADNFCLNVFIPVIYLW